MFRIVPQFPYQATPLPLKCACCDEAVAAGFRPDGGWDSAKRNGTPRYRDAPSLAIWDNQALTRAPIKARRRMLAPTSPKPMMSIAQLAGSGTPPTPGRASAVTVRPAT